MKEVSVSAILCCVVLFLFASCYKKQDTLFKLLSANETGIHFTNSVEATDSFNILTYEYIYNGGGVGIADFNNDGKQDVFFTGNQVDNRLYLNLGDFKFKDITAEANVNVTGRWNSGVSIIDINNDEWPDIYVCATMKPDSLDRKNMLFINNGLNKEGFPTFTEKAAEYKIDDMGFSVNSAFFDYDHDGDLDLYVLTNQKLPNFSTSYRLKIVDGTSPNNDRLYRNNGDGTFSNVSKEAGILIEGFGLGLAISDFNNDGWPDIYVSNDYLSNDILYINNRDGTFKNRIADYIGHQSQFSMGNDVADINNDGMSDIFTVDMLPEINTRKKTTISNKTYQNYLNNKEFGYEFQYVRNMLHINNGLSSGIKFSEIGQLAGVSQTEWSWSPLFADFDNDGEKDLFITNGFPLDITDKDFAIFRSDKENIAGIRYLLDSIPVVKISNYAYKNQGDLTFSDVTKKWGMDKPSFSNGAAFADLDNDGDLDYLVNNINEVAFVYKNNLDHSSGNDRTVSNFLRIKLLGGTLNRFGIGTKISIFYDSGRRQYNENFVYRGFLSTVEGISHFGMGSSNLVDSVFVEWPDGNVQVLKNVHTNQVISVPHSSAFQKNNILKSKRMLPLSKYFTEVSKAIQMSYKHFEEDKVDFNLQRTMPHKFSHSGPGLCVGDINSDGLDDFVVAGSTHYNATLYLQQPDGTFSEGKNRLFQKSKDEHKKEEDEGLLLFDADNDNDLDLYIVSGSLEDVNVKVYQDRFFRNDGKGNFKVDSSALPQITASGSCVRAADFDADGDLDLFVGGRMVAGSYPLPASSYILQNNGGVFTDVTEKVCAELRLPGMVTDAIWSDFDRDGKPDLVLVGEFMPITFFKNDGVNLTKLSTTGIQQYIGWWNSISSGDFDNDGDMDYVAGNLGLNSNYQVSDKYPLTIYAKDFDGNGSMDPIVACYMRESMESDIKKLYPVHFWEELNSQSTKFRRKYYSYKQYGAATLESLLTEDDLKGALKLEANHMASSYMENLGNGKFRMTALPVSAQVAPVNGMVSIDVDTDGNLDIVLIGNDYGNEVFIGRYDACTGLVLLGNGKGTFNVVPSLKSGFYVPQDGKALAKIMVNGKSMIIATQNQDSLKVFSTQATASKITFKPETLDVSATLLFLDGRKQEIEFYYGAGYLSQSTRKIAIAEGVKKLTIIDSKGKSRSIDTADLK